MLDSVVLYTNEIDDSVAVDNVAAHLSVVLDSRVVPNSVVVDIMVLESVARGAEVVLDSIVDIAAAPISMMLGSE